MFDSTKRKIKSYLKRYLHDVFNNFYREENSLENWFYHWLRFQNTDYVKDYSPKNTYYEFGTGSGGTLKMFLRAATRFSSDYNRPLDEIKLFLFDSFQGLPPVTREEDDHPTWDKGYFAYPKNYIEKIIEEHRFPLSNVKFFEGYFNKSLNAETLALLRNDPPSIVTMDVDYYSSTIDALKFIAPILMSGTVFYFDDLYSFFLHPELGQVKAISEFNNLSLGYLNPLTYKNCEGRCYMFARKEWEHFRVLSEDHHQ